MSAKIPFHDSLYRLAHVGASVGVQLVRVIDLAGGNRYHAMPIEFGPSNTMRNAGAPTVTVTNLAEPADAAGTLPTDTKAVAIDVEGRWIIYVRAAVSLSFPARVSASLGGACYDVVEQVADGATGFVDKDDGLSVAARNLAELSLGLGAAVDVGTIVFVTAVADRQDASTKQYVFDHPAYAKYLD